MTQNFYIPITNQKKRAYSLTANFLLLINYCIYLLFTYNLQNNNKISSPLLIATLMFIIVVFRFFFIFKLPKLIFTNLHLSLIGAILWLINGNWILSILLLTLGIFEFIINKDYTCTINSSGVYIDSFPSKKYKWNVLQNIVLTQGILTIDTKKKCYSSN